MRMADPAVQKTYDICLEVLAERARQKRKGYSPDHDDDHDDESLLQAARCFLFGTPYSRVDHRNTELAGPPWPWDPVFDTRAKHSRRKQLIIAMALICAEVERLDR